MQYHFRAATNDDRVAVESLVFDVLAEYGLVPDPAGTDSDLQDIRGSYHASGGTFDVLVDGFGQILGFSSKKLSTAIAFTYDGW